MVLKRVTTSKLPVGQWVQLVKQQLVQKSAILARSHKTFIWERIGESHGSWLVLTVTPRTTHNEALADTQRMQPNTHTATEQSSQKQHANTAETRARINHTLAHTHACFHHLTMAIHPVSLLLSSPLFALLTVGHDLQTQWSEREEVKIKVRRELWPGQDISCAVVSLCEAVLTLNNKYGYLIDPKHLWIISHSQVMSSSAL